MLLVTILTFVITTALFFSLCGQRTPEMAVLNSASKSLAVGHRADPLGELIGNVPSVADALTPVEHMM